jgi:hypothetical protein
MCGRKKSANVVEHCFEHKHMTWRLLLPCNEGFRLLIYGTPYHYCASLSHSWHPAQRPVGGGGESPAQEPNFVTARVGLRTLARSRVSRSYCCRCSGAGVDLWCSGPQTVARRSWFISNNLQAQRKGHPKAQCNTGRERVPIILQNKSDYYANIHFSALHVYAFQEVLCMLLSFCLRF